MVTMNLDKAAAKRKPEPNNGGCTTNTTTTTTGGHEDTTVVNYQPMSATEESPNHLLYKKVHL